MIALEDVKQSYLAGRSIAKTAAHLGITFTQARTRIRRLGITRPQGTRTPRMTKGGLTLGEQVQTPTGAVGTIASFAGNHVQIALQLATLTLVTYQQRDLTPLRKEAERAENDRA